MMRQRPDVGDFDDYEMECDVCGSLVPQHHIAIGVGAGDCEAFACRECRGEDPYAEDERDRLTDLEPHLRKL